MPGVERILAVKLADLGDVLLCEPALRSLRAGYQGARIDVLTTPAAADLVRLIAPWAEPIAFDKQAFDSFPTASPRAIGSASKLAYDLRAAQYDLVVLFHHLVTRYGALKFGALVRATGAPRVAGLDNGRGDFLTDRVMDRGFGEVHEADYMRMVAGSAGGSPVDPEPRLAVDLDSESDQIPECFVGIFPATGAFSTAREWPASRYADLSRWLDAQGIPTVVLGSDDAREAASQILRTNPRAVDYSARTNLEKLARIVAAADLVFGGDSFIGHLAAAVGTPVVAIFGPSNHRAWRPYGAILEADWECGNRSSIGIVITDELPCSPCLYTGYALGRREGCPTRTCLDQIPVDRVVQAVVRLIDAQ